MSVFDMVTTNELLQHLPPFRNERVLIKKNQRVNDIIEQILLAHKKYAHYYDKIAGFFDADTTEEICKNIYSFLHKNVTYKEESDEEQTTALPSAILSLKRGDCKHYSLFSNGVLDALKRKGKKINWYYRFCSYKPFDQTPHHVFCVVNTANGEIWIDPVPGANDLTPIWQLDKTVKNFKMPLYDVIGNTNDGSNQQTIGYTVAENIAHAAAKVTLFAARAAFLLMLRLNVRNWAKDLYNILWTNSTPQAWDNIGKKWYMLGGDAQPFKEAILDGKDKKMLGSVGATIGEPITAASITAAIAAATPIIIAMVPLVRDLLKTINPNLPANYEPGMQIPGGTTTFPGSTPTTGTGLNNLLRNPLVLAGGAGLLYYLYTTQNKKRVGAVNNTLLILALVGGGIYLYNKSKQNTTVPVELPPVVPVVNEEPGDSQTPVIDFTPVEEMPVLKEETMDFNIPVEAYFQ